ncbi:MAG: GNAT family N-acetyltransferase [Lachnospiraceae bacterium]
MQATTLDFSTLVSIYETYGTQYFPKDELKPISAIQTLYHKQHYCGLGFYEKESLIGFAFFVIDHSSNTLLLDYFAVLEEYRCFGYGSKLLMLIKETYPTFCGIFIESEDPALANTDHIFQIRKRRTHFYESNKCIDTKLRTKIFGVTYLVYYLPILESPEVPNYFTKVDSIYRTMFPEKHYINNVRYL